MSQNYRRKIGMPIEAEKCILYMGKNQTYELKNIRVQTLTSTDEGVAFFIECEGKSIYHAGDLNWWTWKGETKEEFLEMKKRFQGEIQKIKGKYFDLAFLPLDPRQEEKFYWVPVSVSAEYSPRPRPHNRPLSVWWHPLWQ